MWTVSLSQAVRYRSWAVSQWQRRTIPIICRLIGPHVPAFLPFHRLENTHGNRGAGITTTSVRCCRWIRHHRPSRGDGAGKDMTLTPLGTSARGCSHSWPNSSDKVWAHPESRLGQVWSRGGAATLSAVWTQRVRPPGIEGEVGVDSRGGLLVSGSGFTSLCSTVGCYDWCPRRPLKQFSFLPANVGTFAAGHITLIPLSESAGGCCSSPWVPGRCRFCPPLARCLTPPTLRPSSPTVPDRCWFCSLLARCLTRFCGRATA